MKKDEIFTVFLLFIVALGAFFFGYKSGKRDADYWYARHWTPIQIIPVTENTGTVFTNTVQMTSQPKNWWAICADGWTVNGLAPLETVSLVDMCGEHGWDSEAGLNIESTSIGRNWKVVIRPSKAERRGKSYANKCKC